MEKKTKCAATSRKEEYHCKETKDKLKNPIHSLRNLNIPLIACINLYERPDRYKSCRTEFEKLDILDLVYFYRTHKNITSGRKGCYESHLELYKKAVKEDLEYMLIFEDDFKVNPNYEENKDIIYKNIKKLLNDENVSWSRISLMDTLHISDYTEVYPLKKKTFSETIKNGGIYFANFTNAKCYFIKNDAMKLMIEKGVTTNHIDMELFHSLKDTIQIRILPPLVTDGLFSSDIDWTIDKLDNCVLAEETVKHNVSPQPTITSSQTVPAASFLSGKAEEYFAAALPAAKKAEEEDSIPKEVNCNKNQGSNCTHVSRSKDCQILEIESSYPNILHNSVTNLIMNSKKKITGFFENSKENNMVHKMEYYTDRFNMFLSFYFETTKLIKLVVKLIEFVYYS